MDFGSSHVYAGAPYYSDVPTEETQPRKNDTIYEAVNEIYQHAEQNEDHSYDPVALDAIENERRDYDLVPYEPGLDHSNAAHNSQSAKHAHPKRSLSSTVLHKAKKVGIWKTKKTKTSRSASSMSEIEGVPPPLPPARRTTWNDPLSPTPNSAPSSNRYNKPLPPPPIPRTVPTQASGTSPAIPPKPSSLWQKANQVTTVEELANILSCSNVSEKEKASLSDPLEPALSFPTCLYPSLPNVYADVQKNYQKAEPVPSAPPMEDTVTMDFDLISFTEPVVYDQTLVKRETLGHPDKILVLSFC